ncbi:MAG: bacteriophage abortive infection AbiH family protein [Streptococcaceae bacterium]|jgi:hypothetical protein|nr:bacteriophage abortive infection AbiH family protein [Streptococcaceae bacterium]
MNNKNKKLNISFLIGNGFDIGILKSIGKKHTTTYKEFYDYLSYYLVDKENFIYKEIHSSKDSDLWGDFELILANAIESISDSIKDENSYSKILADWKEIQFLFADFLNLVVTPDILKDVCGLDSEKTLEQFLGDLSEEQYAAIKFPSKTGHHMEIQYNVFNFNYSPLLDNYFYSLFDPHPFSTSENNANFYPDPNEFGAIGKDFWFLKRNLTLYHPHGRISIPSSLLFGTSSNQKYKSSPMVNSIYYSNYEQELKKRLDKPYWSRVDTKISPILNASNLIIIYGHSIGKSDSWWWKDILEYMSRSECELIIYDYHNGNLKEKLFEYCPELIKKLEDRVFLVNFDEAHPLRYGFDFSKEVEND